MITSVQNPLHKFETGYRKKNIRSKELENCGAQMDSGKIEKFVFYRCKQGAQPTIIKTFSGKISEFTDTNLNMGNIYEYRIKPVYVNEAEELLVMPL